MIRCTFRLNGAGMSVLSCPGVGFFRAYSGYAGTSRNNPNDISVPDTGPLPTGRYYIVNRTQGGRLGYVNDLAASVISGSDRDVWFALFRDDGSIDDLTFIDKVERGNFRLHPAGYKGISEGCITFPSKSDYAIFRTALLQTATMMVTASLTAYGTVQVY
ncbi:DUF2778 domain-containing protein [Lelliottia amnigena]|jgi:hypothetical protein|uniref:DUF2778 domain-containing protein n=1 Tax=Lelliottia amnigena TaxID=61646 RepID=UPI00301B48C8